MTTIDCAIFSLFEQGPGHHALPFEDEWTDFKFTRTESNSSMTQHSFILHEVQDEANLQDNFDILRLCSQDKPATGEDFMINTLQQAGHAYDLPAHKRCDFQLLGADAPQGQQIRADKQQKGFEHHRYDYDVVPAHPGAWSMEAEYVPAAQPQFYPAPHASQAHFYAPATPAAVPTPAPAAAVAPEQPAAASPASPSSPSEETSKGPKPRSRQNKKPVFWTNEEHDKFVVALKRFNGDDNEGLGAGVAELISMSLGTRTVSQVRSHAQKYFLRLRQQ